LVTKVVAECSKRADAGIRLPGRGYAVDMFGLTIEKLLLIGVIAAFLLGPERLPGYASKLSQLVRTVRDMANGAKSRMRDEMGPEFEDMDWKKLDPRQYDPRRIIREALLDDDGPAAAAAVVTPRVSAPKPTLQKSAEPAPAVQAPSVRVAAPQSGEDPPLREPAPFDSDAT
jgi:sec-independent protein translocase protein TatB